MSIRAINDAPSVNTPSVALGSTLSVVTSRDVRVYRAFFCNTDTSDHQVTLQDGTNEILHLASVPAGQTYDWNLGDRGIFFKSGVQWKADTGAKVNAFIDFSFVQS